MDSSFIFLHGLTVRTGTNFMGRFFNKHPEIQVVPFGETTQEFPLLKNLHEFEKAFNAVRNDYHGPKEHYVWKEFMPYLGDAFMKFLMDKHKDEKNAYFVKDPNFNNIGNFFDIFPEQRLIIILRDGRDIVSSSIKASIYKRSYHSWTKHYLRKVSRAVKRHQYFYSYMWAERVKDFNKFLSSDAYKSNRDKVLVVKYEEILQQPEAEGKRIFEFCGVSSEKEILDQLRNIEVMGSSFLGKSGIEDAKKPNWNPVDKPKEFKPMGRWKDWDKLDKIIFKKFAGDALIQLGYEKNNSW